MMHTTYNNPGQMKRGYTLLFAVLVSALVLSVGISILNISKKEFLLSSSSRESATAFYAADSGLECAKFYDYPGTPDQFTVENYRNTMKCGLSDNIQVGIDNSNPNLPEHTFTFTVKLDTHADANSCAIVVITKNVVDGTTVMDSSGYNLGWDDNLGTCTKTSPKKVERVLHYDYSTAAL